MSETITNYLTSPDDKLTNISIEKQYNDKYSKYDIYNHININTSADTEINHDNIYQKIWLLTPKLKIYSVINKMYDKFNYSMPFKLILFNNNPEHKRLILFIKRLERKINLDLKKSINNIKNKSSLENKENYVVFSCLMPINNGELTFHIYNANNYRISLDELKSKLDTRVYLELTNIYIKDNFIGYNWTVLQMKVYPGFDFSKCLFDDVPEDREEKDKKTESCYHCMFCPSNHVRTALNYNYTHTPLSLSPPPPPPPPIINITSTPNNTFNKKEQKTSTPNQNIIASKSLYITVNDLLSVRDRLKSVSNKQEEKQEEKQDMTEISSAISSLKDL